MTNEDAIARQSRLMIGGKRGPKLVGDFQEADNTTFTYNPDNTLNTMTIQRTSLDGTLWQKVITFSYTGGNLTGKSEVLTNLG